MPVRHINMSRFLVQQNGVRRNANLDFGTTPQDWVLQPAAGRVCYVKCLLIQIEDDSPFLTGGYGAIGALANGILVLIYEGSVLRADLTDGLPIISHEDWARYCHDIRSPEFVFGTQRHVHARWDFNIEQSVIRLRGSLNERLVIRFRDNLSGLINHTFTAKGYEGGTDFI